MLAAAVLFGACGGGTGATTPPAAAPISPPAATTPGATTTTPSTTGTDGVVLVGSQLKTSSITPPAFKAAIGKRPMLVLMYQPKSTIDDAEQLEFAAASHAVKDLAVFQFTIAQYTQYQDILEQLGMFGTPSVAVVDRSGTVQNVWNGNYVDRNLIRRAVVVAAAVHPAKVSPSDAPAPAAAAPSGLGATGAAASAAGDAATTAAGGA